MAGQHDAHRVRAVGQADRAHGGGPADALGQFAVADGFAARDAAQRGDVLGGGRVALGDDDEVNFYASLTFVAPVFGSRIRLLIDGIEVGDPRPVESGEALIVWALSMAELRRLAKPARDGLVAINLQFDLVGVTPAAIEASRALDPRGLTFGLKSFLLLGAGAMADRLRIAERNNYKLVC